MSILRAQGAGNSRRVMIDESASPAPPASGVAIVPSDSTIYSPPLRGIRNGGVGAVTVVVDFRDAGVNIAYHNVASGETLVGYFTKVKAATTGTDLVGTW